MVADLTLEVLLDALADRIAERMAKREAGLISQRDRRGLGKRRHINAVRRRIAERQGGAFKLGDDYMLTPEAVREELERFGPKGLDDGAPSPASPSPSPRRTRKSDRERALADLDRELDEHLTPTNRGRR